MGKPLSTLPSGANPLVEWFDTGTWVPSALGTYGDSGRNRLIGPKEFDYDFGHMKHIPLTERLNMVFHFEAFNFFNHPSFNNPESTQNSALLGRIVSASASRVIQFAGKFDF